MRPATGPLLLAALLMLSAGAAAGQITGKHTTSEAARPPCVPADERLLSPRARRAELQLLRAQLMLVHEQELAQLRRRIEAQLEARERELGGRQGDRALNLP
ncbi:MAG: hypothetical protein KGM44_01330 [bacterium]|nr:hypothetical protein [bacterium]